MNMSQFHQINVSYGAVRLLLDRPVNTGVCLLLCAARRRATVFSSQYKRCLKGKMPIDLVIDERDGTKPDLGDTNNNSGAARASTADTSHTDGSSTPDVVRPISFGLLLTWLDAFFLVS